MKFYIYKAKGGTKVHFYNEPMNGMESDKMHDFLGTVDLDIQKPTKIVKKELDVNKEQWQRSMVVLSQILDNHSARNIKITYEVEE